MKKLLIIFALTGVGIAAVVILVSKNNESTPSATSKIKIAASFYPLAEFAKQVGADIVEVTNIVPPGIEPHDFEPTAQDIARVYSARLFIFNGSGLDPWAEKIAAELGERHIAVIHMAEHFDLPESADEHEEGMDPHIWLDPELAKKEVEIIKDALRAVDPENSAAYELNAEQYLAKLSQLDKKYTDGLASCTIRDVVLSHAAFGYLAKRYNLNAISVAGLSPEEEASAKRIAEISEFAREKNLEYIFFETLVSPKLAETIANEIGAKTLVFNPLEGLSEEELADGKNYILVMEENLANLRQALTCK
jgi:zinc transport system substrate-binding protein